MRAIVRAAIIADATLTGLGVVPAGVMAGNVDTPTMRPFLNLRWGVTTPGLATVNKRILVVWAHDRPGDYTVRIDPIIVRLRTVLGSLVGVSNGLGHVVDVEWTGDSEDLVDDGHGTITRTASFNLVGSGQ
jgi:hypothetical protein